MATEAAPEPVEIGMLDIYYVKGLATTDHTELVGFETSVQPFITEVEPITDDCVIASKSPIGVPSEYNNDVTEDSVGFGTLVHEVIHS